MPSYIQVCRGEGIGSFTVPMRPHVPMEAAREHDIIVYFYLNVQTYVGGESFYKGETRSVVTQYARLRVVLRMVLLIPGGPRAYLEKPFPSNGLVLS